MNELKIFENPEFGQVRMVIINNEPYFVGKDVAGALGYQNGSRDVNVHVDDEDKLRYQISTAGQMREQIVINESGVYSLVFGSKLHNAKKFKHWVTHEVLPAIRKTGSYSTMDDMEILSRAVLISNKKIEELKALTECQKAKIAEQAPKVLFSDTVAGSKTSILIGELAKMVKQTGKLDIGQNRLFKWMREHGYLMKAKNEPTQKSMELKVMEVKERTVNNPDGSTRTTRTPMVTGKGQVYFVNKLIGE